MPKPQLKTSIYLDTEILRIISEREVGPGTRSEVVRSAVERYAEICERCRPKLTGDQWELLFHVLDEEWLAKRLPASYVSAAVQDWEARLGKSGQPHVTELLTALEHAGFPGQVAIVDAAERHCAEQRRNEESPRS